MSTKITENGMAKAPSGTVSVGVARGKLRLYWRHSGKRYFLNTGLIDNPVNRLVCESLAKSIEADCATDNFDPTLAKYKGEKHSKSDRTPAHHLFSEFIRWKESKVYARTLEKYRALRGIVEEYFRDKPATKISENDAERFKSWLLSPDGKDMSEVTVKERIGLLKACWEWAEKQRKVEENPWTEIKIKVPPKQPPKPMSVDEMKAVMKAFWEHPEHQVYADYVEVLFTTGMRIAEAIGIRVKDLKENCTQLWIGESLSRRVRKATKTYKARTIKLTPRLSELFKTRIEDADPDDLVFTSPQGFAIDDGNFRNRAWVTCLKIAKVEYRKPYITRSSFISNALLSMHPTEVSQLTGHSLKTLYRDYAGYIKTSPELPELF